MPEDATKKDKLTSPGEVLIDKTKRHGRWFIDYEANDADILKKLLRKIIPKALEECDPVTRKLDTTVVFLPKIVMDNANQRGNKKGKAFEAVGISFHSEKKRRRTIAISKSSIEPRDNPDYAESYIHAIHKVLQ